VGPELDASGEHHVEVGVVVAHRADLHVPPQGPVVVHDEDVEVEVDVERHEQLVRSVGPARGGEREHDGDRG